MKWSEYMRLDMFQYRSGKPRAHRLPQLCAALLFMVLLAASPTSSSATPAIAPLTPALQAAGGFDIPCAQTPVGRVLRLNQANQVFLGYTSADAPYAGRLGSYRFALNASSQLAEQFIADPTTAPPSIAALAGTTADLAGDGKQSFVQAFSDATKQTRFVVNTNGAPVQTAVDSNPDQSAISLASGDVLGRNDGTQQVALASSGAGGTYAGIYAGDGLQNNQALSAAYWISNRPDRLNTSLVRLAVGNLDNSPTVGVVLAFLQSDQQTIQLVYLQYQPGYTINDGVTTAKGLQERASVTFSPGTIRDLQLTLADLHGTGRRTVVLGWQFTADNSLGLLGWNLRTANGGSQFVTDSAYRTGPVASNFALASGDLYAQQRDQLVLAYGTDNALNIITLGPNAPGQQYTTLDTWQDGQGYRNNVGHLALAVGDLDKDNRAEIVAAFKDANPLGFQTIYLDADPSKHLQLKDSSRHDATLAGPITLSLGDWNNDSVRASVGGRCARVVDANVAAVGFVPPYWQNIQGNQQKGGSIGRSVTQAAAAEQSVTLTRSNTVSAFIGAGVQAEIPGLFEVSASAKATAAQEYAMSNRQTTGTMTTTVTTVGQSWMDDALVYDPSEYNCYSYQLSSNNTSLPADQANLRYCAFQGLPGNSQQLQASELNSWDTNFGTQPEYTPALRDWSSLALFRGAFTAQSSNAASAPLAVDGAIVSGSFVKSTVAQTANEAHPWWQIDLGAVQPLTKIRLWTPPASLSNVYVFVSNTDFRTIPGGNDPNTLLVQPGVRHYSLADLGNGFAMSTVAPPETTFLTLDAMNNPIQGRYVRVQRADTAVLALAQVQIFGANHVEPDRYPIDLRPGAPGSGAFQVLLYNPFHTSADNAYVWVQERGNLLWDGRQSAPQNGLTVDRGNTIVDWSLSKGTGNTQVQAQELDTTSSIGAEFEAEAGSWFTVSAGGGVENSRGLATEATLSTSWSNELNMGGQVQGFPHDYDGAQNSWVLGCRYRFQPYYYELTDPSNLGHQQRFPVLDYLVPSGGRAADLDRTLDLAACRNGNLPGPMQANGETAQTAPGQPIVLNVLANDTGNDLTIVGAGPAQHGAVAYTARAITYTPDRWFTGTDSFTYTIQGNASSTATGTVTVRVGGMGGTRIFLPFVRR
jgi:hypothetical protein